MSEPPVRDAQLAAYREHGFVVVPRLFGAETCARWVTHSEAIAHGQVPPAPGLLVMRDVMVAKGAVAPGSRLEAIAKLQDFENDPVLWPYVTDEHLLAHVERFVGSEVFSLHTMLVNKPPHVDGRHPLHQDLLYFPFRPADRIVGAWTALERATRENGCLVVVPGSHRGELRPHENLDWEWVNPAYWGARGVGPDAPRVHLEMETGDTVFFHPLLLHGSGRNRTPDFRRAISAHFASLSCRWAWNVPVDRPYRIVRGPGAGGAWSGPRQGELDPSTWLPRGRRREA